MQSLTHIIKVKESIIDNRESKYLKQSIIDRETERLRILLQDPTLHAGFVKKILGRLSEYQIDSYADYAVRKGTHKGKAFVALCEKMMHKENPRENVSGEQKTSGSLAIIAK